MIIKGKKLVVYFYPKDNTPGCTQEGQRLPRPACGFLDRPVPPSSASPDSVRSHENFAAKFGFTFRCSPTPKKRPARHST